MKRRLILFLLPAFAIGLAPAEEEVPGLSPEQAYQRLTADDKTYLIDVRTPAEYSWVGHPVVESDGGPAEGKVVHIPFLLWSLDEDEGEYAMRPRETFLQDVAGTFPKDSTLIFICRSGGRSAAAIRHLMDPAHSKGKRRRKIESYEMFNLLEGFEGGRDPETKHRTLEQGWKNKGLPYADGTAGIWTPDGKDE